MTSIREAVRRWFAPGMRQAPSPAEYSYGVHWTRTARTWDAARREKARAALLELTRRADFAGTGHEREYIVVDVDETPHAGASLIALLGVLDALERTNVDPPERKP